MKFNPDTKSRFKILKGGKISLIISSLFSSVTLTFAAPSGGVVTSGSANISVNGATTNINQSSQNATINWNNFSIASNETVNFNQPNVNSITLNRVVGNERSVINGALNANGQVWLLNSNGILFGKNASVNTAGLLATTSNISDENFNAGNYVFEGTSDNSVINLGSINISDEGYASLFAKEVVNEGTIKAVRGKVTLTGASKVTINLNGNSMVNLTVDKGVLDALVENKGAVYADGGEVYLTTNAVDELLKGVVNNTGIVEAQSLDDMMGKVELFAAGGSIENNGVIDTSSNDSNGGTISLQADNIVLNENSKLNSSGKSNGGDIFVGGGWQGKDADLYNAKDVEVNKGTTVNSSSKDNGNAGTVVFWSDDAMRFAGDIKAKGGESSGNGGKVEVSGKDRLAFLGTVDTSSPKGENGSLLLDPSTIIITNGSSGQTGTRTDWENHSARGTYVIPETVLEALTGDVSLTAVTDIIIEDLADNELTLSATNMYFFANDESSQSSVGGFTMRDTTDTIFLNKGSGSKIIFQGGNISSRNSGVSSASIYLGNVRTAGADVLFHTKRSGAATPMVVKGNITTNGGDITLEAGTRFGLTNSNIVDVTFDGLVNTGGGNFDSQMTGAVNVNGGMNLGNGTATFGGTNTNINSVIESTNNVNVATPLNFGVGSGITTSGTITFGSTTNMLSGGDLTLTANNFVFNNTFNGNNSDITLKPYNIGTNVDIGVGGSGDMLISADALSKLDSFNNIVIGRTDGTGSTTVTQNTSVTTNSSLELINNTINITGGTLSNTTGNIILTGNVQNITKDISSKNGSGSVTVQQLTASDTINLGGSNVLGADLTKVNSDTLIIGRSNGGDVNFLSDLTTSFNTVHIKSAGNITGVNGGVSANNLALSAGGSVNITDSTFDFTNLALNVGANSEITSSNAFNIGSVDGLNGINTNGNDLKLVSNASTGNITQSNSINSNLLNIVSPNVGVVLQNTSNSINTLQGNVKSLDFLNSSTLSLNDISTSGKINIATSNNNINISGNLTTTSSSSDAIILNAGKNESSGTSTGGDVIYSSGSLNTGTNGGSILYTGSISGSTGITSLSQDGAYRYNSDETTTNYTASLGTGTSIIYRERPVLKVSIANKSISYGDSIPTSFTNSYTGFVNNDDSSSVSGSSTYTVNSSTLSTSGNRNIGNYDVSYSNGLSSSLGYGFENNTASLNELTITKKDITVSATGNNKVYDGLTSATSVLTSSGLVSGDTVTFSGTSTFTDKNVGTSKTINVSSISSNGVDAGNYNITNATANTTADITKKDITVSATGNNKVYDGLTSATSVLTSSGLVSGDTVTFSGTSTFTDKNVGTSKTINVSSISSNGVDAGNYNITNATANTTADITKKDITVSATGNNKVYDGLTSATSVLTSSGLVSGDTVTFSGTSTFTDKNVGTSKTINVSSISSNGVDAGNYNITNTTANTTANVTKKDISAINISASNKIYDGTLNTTLINDGSLSGVVLGDDVSLSTIATFSDVNVGTNKLVSLDNTISGADSSNYNIIDGTTTANITPKAITVSANDLTKVYGNTDATLSYVANGLVGSDSLGGTLSRVAGENVGEYTISQGTLANSNYDITFTNGKYTITPKAITVSANDLTKVYGNTDATLSYVANGLVGSDSLGGTLSRVNGENVGEYTISQGTLANSNYDITFTNGKYTITPKPITVRANDVSKVYGSAEKDLTYIVTQLESGDSLNGAITREAGENVGEYTISQGTLANSNYEITFVDGKYVITPKVEAPKVETPVIETPKVEQKVEFVSEPLESGNTKKITMSAIKQIQTEKATDTKEENTSNTPVVNDVRVQLSQNSIVELVNGGINLPEGVEQEFYVVDSEENR